MSKDAIQALKAQLGAEPPPGLAVLAEDQVRDLAAAVQAASRRQAQALQEAGDRALGRIPRILRGPVRKVAGG